MLSMTLLKFTTEHYIEMSFKHHTHTQLKNHFKEGATVERQISDVNRTNDAGREP